MKNKFLGICVILSIFWSMNATPSQVKAAELIQVDTALVLNSGLANGTKIGINVNYWEDDETRRPAGSPSLSSTLSRMKVTHLRYPGGSKSDVYRWSVPPYSVPAPRLALISPSNWPSNDIRFWSPAGNPNGNWARNVLDFDEFMTQCLAIHCEPDIVVAYGSIYTPPNGADHITYQEALDMAVAWVRYANITRGYNVKYWEIGNETWVNNYANQDPGRITQANDLIAFSRAMKAVDPTIKIGVNGNSQADFDTLLSIAAPNIDFLVVHRYPPYGLADYAAYQATTLNTQDSVNAAYNALQHYPAHKDRIKIMMTEISGMTFGAWNQADLGHALMTFESMARVLQDSRVEYSMLWNTRWIEATQGEAFALTPENNYTPQGWALHILGNYMLDQMVSATSTSSVLAFASKDPNSGDLNVFLVNKSLSSSQAEVIIQNYTTPATGTIMALTGNGPADQNPVFASQGAVAVKNNLFTVSLNPVSITVIQFHTSIELSAMPITGYAPKTTTFLPPQPRNFTYNSLGDIWLEIPSLNIKGNIVGVPKEGLTWDIKWLGNDIGWLNGTAFPTWEGNSVLTAHVYNANGQPGPFANIKSLKYGDQMIIHLFGEKYIFEVRNAYLAQPDTPRSAFAHLENYAYLTLITCEDYDADTASYQYRRIIRSILVKAQNEDYSCVSEACSQKSLKKEIY